ncbi:MAG: carboxypeptidase regulatory-like domain-containing protein [Acidobacteriota bacterium]|nr:carboxypeptidase regulatory-like domain-containing protein [Acidobacteriota bacterium]
MKSKFLIILSILMATCLFTSVAAAQSGGNYTIMQSVIAGGGGSSSGGNYAVTGTVGQPAAGTTSGGGAYSLAGGFWSAAPAGTIKISGTITLNGNPMQGVTVTLSGSASGTTTTNSSGYYEFLNLLSGGTYTVTPSQTGYVFTPPSETFVNLQADQTANFVATQCTYSLNPTSVNIAAAATSGSFTVTAPAGCSWTAVPNDGWLSITSGSPGSGNGTVNYSVGPNSGAARVGTITVAGQTFTVNQALGHLIEGVIAYGIGNGKFVPGVTVTATGPNTIVTTSAYTPAQDAGKYSLQGLTNGANYTVTPTKTNHISGVTAFDATLVLRCVAAGPVNCALTDNQKFAANSDGDTNITAFDATQILRYVAANGPNANTGQVGTWKFVPSSRVYSNLQSNIVNENYSGFVIGDVDGDWVQPQQPPQPQEFEGQQSETESFNLSTEEEADDATTIRVSLPRSLSAAKGNTVLIPVMLSNQTRREISSFAVNVTYDSAVLKIDEDNPIETTGTLTEIGSFAVAAHTETAGRVGIAAAGSNSFANAAGTLVNLRFTIVGEAKVSKKGTPLSLTRAAFQDQFGAPITAKGGKQQITFVEKAP